MSGATIYAYVGGNPLGAVDPWGLQSLPQRQSYDPNDVRGGFDSLGNSLVYHPQYYNPGAASELLLTMVMSFATGPSTAMCRTGVASKSAIQILDREGNIIIGAFKGAKGEARVITEVVRNGDQLILNGTHIEGAATLKEALNAAKIFGREQGAKEVIIQGGVRTTGANPGHLPRPITIKTN